MTKQIVDNNEDGTVIGYENGALFRGTPRQIGLDNIVYEVQQDDESGMFIITGSLGGVQISNERILIDQLYPEQEVNLAGYIADHPEADVGQLRATLLAERHHDILNPVSRKQYRQMLDAEGNEISVEVTATVYEWEAM